MYRKRLKNVYELLESGNNKKVIQEVDKLVTSTANLSLGKKKLSSTEAGLPGYDEQTTLVIAKALKALALVRVGRKTDSDSLIDELLCSNTTDENALSIIMQYCKETHQLTKIAVFYENAANKLEAEKASKQQDYEEILVSLFNAYVRNRDFKKQQQLALKLYKHTGKLMFSYWNAASYVLMAKAEQKPEQRTLYLKLAEKILEKAYGEKKMEYNGEFQLYLEVLESLGKYAEALKVIGEFDHEKHLAKIGHPNFKFMKQLLYFKNLNNLEQLRKSCEEYFMQRKSANLDDWTVYTQYFDCVINKLKSADQMILVEEVLQFLKNLETLELLDASNSRSTAPFVAQIEFINQIVLVHQIQELSESVVTCLKLNLEKYIRQCCCQPGFFYDITKFSNLIEKANLKEFVLNLCKLLYDESLPFKSIKAIYTAITYWQLNRFFGQQQNLTQDQSKDLVLLLEDLYHQSLPFGKDLLPTAFQYGDDFLLMSVHIGYDLWKKFKHESLLHLVAKLKMGLKNSPTNFQIKLLLLNLYSHLGAYDSIKSMYDSMDIKNIQYYSTSNLLIFNNIRLGSFESSAQVHSTMDTFFNSGLFDLTSFMVNCYKYGTFLKAFEINSFIDELKKSLTVHVCLTNHVIQQIVMDQVNIKEHDASETDLSTGLSLMETKIEQYFKNLNQLSNLVDKSEFFSEQSSLVDHSDTNVVYDWSPPNQQQKTSQNRLCLIEEQKKLLKLRILWIKFIYLNFKNQFSDEKFTLIKTQLANFEYGKQEPSDLEIFNSKSNYLKEFLKLNLDKIVTNFVHLIADMALGEDFLANDSKVLNYRNEFKKLFENLELEAPDANTESLSAVLESLSAVVETLSIFIVSLVSVLGNEFYKPIWTEKCKKSKKKKGVYLKYAQTVDMLFEIYEFLFDALNKLLNSFDKFKLSANFVDGLIQKIDDQSVDFSDLTQSYRKSFEELRKIYSAKVKFLLKFSQNSVLKP